MTDEEMIEQVRCAVSDRPFILVFNDSPEDKVEIFYSRLTEEKKSSVIATLLKAMQRKD